MQLLMSGKYVKFVISIICCALLFTIIPNIVFFIYDKSFQPLSEVTIVDNISAFVIFILCISGVIIPVFLKNWMESNLHLNHLKIKQESSQVEQLKEQINPDSFFKILNKSGSLVKSDPAKASAMLMKLGQLLRYQLYDCNREEVFLTAEISFLRNFLALESMYSPKFSYSIETKGNLNGIFMSPSVLLPYVQSVINCFNDDKAVHNIDVQVNSLEEKISIQLLITGIYQKKLENELLKMRQRLDTLYKGHYKIDIADNQTTGKIEVVLNLDKK